LAATLRAVLRLIPLFVVARPSVSVALVDIAARPALRENSHGRRRSVGHGNLRPYAKPLIAEHDRLVAANSNSVTHARIEASIRACVDHEQLAQLRTRHRNGPDRSGANQAKSEFFSPT